MDLLFYNFLYLQRYLRLGGTQLVHLYGTHGRRDSTDVEVVKESVAELMMVAS